MIKRGLGPITLMAICHMAITLITLIIRVIGARWLLYIETWDRTKGRTKETAIWGRHRERNKEKTGGKDQGQD